MSRESSRPAIPVKQLLITILVSLLLLAGLLVLFSRVLMLFDHYEKYYETVCYLLWGCEALFLSGLSRKVSQNPFLYSLIVSVSVSLICAAAGLLFGKGLELAGWGLRLSFYVCFSLLLSALPKKKTGRAVKRHKR